jgi:hypothetical protein
MLRYFSLVARRDVVLKHGQVHKRLVEEDVLHPPARSRLSISSTSRFRTGWFSFIKASSPARL